MVFAHVGASCYALNSDSVDGGATPELASAIEDLRIPLCHVVYLHDEFSYRVSNEL